MKSVLMCAAALWLASPALAGSYRVVLSQPEGGKLLKGHAGVQAADERNSDVLIRLISPGNEVKERGTVRVLVLNYGPRPFEFGPDQVKLILADGTVLKPTPFEKFDKGRNLIVREQGHARAVDLANSNILSSFVQDSGAAGGTPASAPTPAMSGSAASYGAETGEFDRQTEESDLPGADLLNALDQLLVPLSVGPRQAWGGYYVFDVPKAVFDRKTDQPLTVIIATGAETHEFPATLHWK
jgi:hypothetical protein